MNDVKESSQLEEMIRRQVIERGIRDERVLNALRSVPRDKFFSADSANEAFADRAAPIGHGQTISQPYMVALMRSEEHTSELQSQSNLVCRLLLEKKKEIE